MTELAEDIQQKGCCLFLVKHTKFLAHVHEPMRGGRFAGTVEKHEVVKSLFVPSCRQMDSVRDHQDVTYTEAIDHNMAMIVIPML